MGSDFHYTSSFPLEAPLQGDFFIIRQGYLPNQQLFSPEILAVLEPVTFFYSRMRRRSCGPLARAKFSQDTPVLVAYQLLEPPGLPHIELTCAHGYGKKLHALMAEQ